MLRNRKVYLVLTPTFKRWAPREIDGFRVDRMTQGKPSMTSGEMAVRVNLTLDTALFEEHIPELSLVVGERTVIAPPSAEVLDAPASDE